MKRLLAIIVVVLLFVSATDKKPIRVACIGDSITFGSTIKNRKDNSYPVQLGKMLGEKYNVQNFGLSGHTMLFMTERPYMKTDRYKEMLEFAPDIVFICLGTNDSKTIYRGFAGQYEHDYKAMIDSIKTKLPDSRIILMTPPKAHNEITKFNIDAAYITDTIVPSVKKIAYEKSLELIDLHPIFDKYSKTLMPDKVHPSALGAALISSRMYDYLTMPTEEYVFDSSFKQSINYLGFNSYRFAFDDKEARIAVPKKVAEGRPWVWRARFWGAENSVDAALLERGYHIVYTDVSEMFGNDAAVAQWERFYKYVTGRGLAPKCAIEATSRGGLIAYNFAVKNPEKVSVVYAYAPVLDIKSWPIGNSKYPDANRKLLVAYGFSSVEQAKAFDGNPMDNAELIAKCGFDMIHVCGNKDKTAPVSRNTRPFKDRIETAGGKLTYIELDNVGHHTHGIMIPMQVVKQILISTGQYRTPTTVPTPGAEYRTGYDWVSVAEEITKFTSENKYKILLLGNSITQGFGSDRVLAKQRTGKQAMDQAFGEKTWFSAGINGDRTQHLLYRILNGGYEACEPKYVVITIGINNVNAGLNSAEETIEGIVKCVEAAQFKMPKAKIILFGALPAQRSMQKCVTIAEALKKHKWNKRVTYVDPFPTFAPGEKNIIEEYYKKDKLHLDTKGYEVWVELMKQHF